MNEKNKLYSYKVRFRGNKIETYTFGAEIKCGSTVIVNIEKGFDVAKASIAKPISEKDAELLPKIQRVATQEDIERIARNKEKEKNAFRLCKERIEEHKLDMKLVSVEMRFDGGKLTFYFTSPQRVDFRELVKSLAGIYHTRIDLRQVRAREEASLVSGIGPCGRILCCSSCNGELKDVTTQHIKDQQLPMNPAKNSGRCGHYLCCLNFEEEFYLDVYTRLPHAGNYFITQDGRRGEITYVDVFKEMIEVKFIEKNVNEKQFQKFDIFNLEQIRAGKVEESKNPKFKNIYDIENEGEKNESL